MRAVSLDSFFAVPIQPVQSFRGSNPSTAADILDTALDIVSTLELSSVPTLSEAELNDIFGGTKKNNEREKQ